ncbi:hypothetical protein RN001_008927 [Aquatica leii]|uniref:Uncharacterized protein n=1 Tax=Aquatica leii TaxID=1421715 RepID=A0AAN7PDZ8_9COLE|nr:hypothetical protein RN001_008927 [Aquatica leii]
MPVACLQAVKMDSKICEILESMNKNMVEKFYENSQKMEENSRKIEEKLLENSRSLKEEIRTSIETQIKIVQEETQTDMLNFKEEICESVKDKIEEVQDKLKQKLKKNSRTIEDKLEKKLREKIQLFEERINQMNCYGEGSVTSEDLIMDHLPWSTYYKQFEAAATVNGWSNKQKATSLIVFLRGEENYELLILRLEIKYEDSYLQQVYQAQTKSRVQKAAESLQEFDADIARLTRFAYPTTSDDFLK